MDELTLINDVIKNIKTDDSIYKENIIIELNDKLVEEVVTKIKAGYSLVKTAQTTKNAEGYSLTTDQVRQIHECYLKSLIKSEG